jgi:hypothetical protein
MKKRKWLDLILLTAICMLFIGNSSIYAQDWTYYEQGGEIYITAYNGANGNVVVPNTIDGKPVVDITDAFHSLTHVDSVVIQEGVRNIGDGTFSLCSAINVTIPSSVTALGEYAFYKSKIENITIPSAGLKVIGYRAFQNCNYLKNFNLPSTVIDIGEEAFYGCFGVNFSLPNGLTSIKSKVFYACWSLTGITIPSSVTEIGDYAFYNCNSLTSMVIPSSVKTIGAYAFSKCSFTNVIMHEGVTSIPNNAFYECEDLQYISIPASVIEIQESAFERCKNLAAAYFCGNAPSIGTNVFFGCAEEFKIYYILGASGWSSSWWGYTAVVNSTGNCIPPSTSTTTTMTPGSTTTTTTISGGETTTTTISGGETTTTTVSGGGTTTTTVSGGWCPFTQALGFDNPKLENLQDFRDSKLAQSAIGRKVIQIYYTNADSINAALDRSPILRAATRRALEVIAPMVGNKQ